MSRTPIGDMLRDNAGRDRLRFHMPGHKGRGHRIFAEDITEIPGADNLHDPQGVIAESQRVIASLYRARESRLLVGGTTAGILAALLAGAGPEGRVLIPTNAHRSVFAAMHIGRLSGHFIDPAFAHEPWFPKSVSVEAVETALDRDPEICGMILTSPTYYGTVSDTAAIAGALHRRGKWLIVDEAHGAHLAFWNGGPRAALDCGADVVVSSTHKILGAPTMGSVLLIGSERIDSGRISDWLSQIESSSPSYLLMAGIEAAVVEGAEASERVFHAIAEAHDWAVKRFSDPASNLFLIDGPASLYDKSKWVFGVRDGSGLAIAQTLRERYGLYVEMETPEILLAMTGIGTTAEDLGNLIEAMARVNGPAPENPVPPVQMATLSAGRFNQRVPFWRAADLPKRSCPLTQAAGQIAGQMLIPYPPGVPAALPGDTLSPDMVSALTALVRQGVPVLGVEQDQIQVLAFNHKSNKGEQDV